MTLHMSAMFRITIYFFYDNHLPRNLFLQKIVTDFNWQAEEERKLKEEQERREHEEYLKMKEMFSVDEEGESEQAGDLDVSFVARYQNLDLVLNQI